MSGESGAHQILVGTIVATTTGARRATRKGCPNHPIEFKRAVAAAACDPQVSVDPERGKTKTGRLWTYVRDDRPAASRDPPAVWYRYSPDRKSEHPHSLRRYAR